MLYKYRAKKGPDEIIEGKIEAANKDEAIEKLNQMEYLPIRIEEDTHPAETVSPLALKKPLGKVKSREITIFSRQLASLLKSGVPILHAINIIAEQSENNNFILSLTMTPNKASCEAVLTDKCPEDLYGDGKWQRAECGCTNQDSYLYEPSINKQPILEPYIWYIDINGYPTVIKVMDFAPELEKTMIYMLATKLEQQGFKVDIVMPENKQ